KCAPKIAPLIGHGTQKNIVRHCSEGWIRLEPEANRQTESMFLFREDLFREKPTGRAFKQVAFFKTLHLQPSRQTSGELREEVVEIWETNLDIVVFCRPGDLRNIFVTQSHVDVDVHQSIQFGVSVSSSMMSARRGESIAIHEWHRLSK